MTTLLTYLPIAIAWGFAASSLLHLMGPRWLTAMYERWDYPRAFPIIAAVLNMAAAVLLASPEFRAYGIAVSAVIAFFSAVAIIANEKPVYAAPSILLMAALVPAVLTVPSA